MNLAHISQKVATLTEEAGAFIVKEFHQFSRSQIEYKGLNDMVSYVDKQAELMLVEGLNKLLPEAGFIAEEGTGTPSASGLNWIIDPLDGTTNFIHGVPHFAVSVALCGPEEDLLVGVVNKLPGQEVFHTYKGGGAFCNQQRIQVSHTAHLAQSLVATGFPYYDFEKIGHYMELLRVMMERSHGLRRFGSAALDLAYVAAGRFDSFFEYNLNAWDIAAGVLLVREAGGTVTDFSGSNQCLFRRELLAAGPTHAELKATIQQHFFAS